MKSRLLGICTVLKKVLVAYHLSLSRIPSLVYVLLRIFLVVRF